MASKIKLLKVIRFMTANKPGLNPHYSSIRIEIEQ